MKIVIFVEGETEKAGLQIFFKRWLDEHLKKKVGVVVYPLSGSGKYQDDIALKTQTTLNAPNNDVLAVFGLLDLYGSQIPFPSHCTTVAEQYGWGKQYLEDIVQEARFRQHFAVHETEAWLLSDPTIFPVRLREALKRKLKNKPPETINHGYHPSRLIKDVYSSEPGMSYRKVQDGRRLFSELSHKTALQKCPYLKQLLEDMLQFAQGDHIS